MDFFLKSRNPLAMFCVQGARRGFYPDKHQVQLALELKAFPSRPYEEWRTGNHFIPGARVLDIQQKVGLGSGDKEY